VLNEKLPGEDTIMLTAICTILLSVVGHGLSANPLVSKLFTGKAGSVGR
jgi:NhaP-type Na+/H+ or K+/H+ antiporter